VFPSCSLQCSLHIPSCRCMCPSCAAMFPPCSLLVF
jgi:hypothetical protein